MGRKETKIIEFMKREFGITYIKYYSGGYQKYFFLSIESSQELLMACIIQKLT